MHTDFNQGFNEAETVIKLHNLLTDTAHPVQLKKSFWRGVHYTAQGLPGDVNLDAMLKKIAAFSKDINNFDRYRLGRFDITLEKVASDLTKLPLGAAEKQCLQQINEIRESVKSALDKIPKSTEEDEKSLRSNVEKIKQLDDINITKDIEEITEDTLAYKKILEKAGKAVVLFKVKDGIMWSGKSPFNFFGLQPTAEPSRLYEKFLMFVLKLSQLSEWVKQKKLVVISPPEVLISNIEWVKAFCLEQSGKTYSLFDYISQELSNDKSANLFKLFNLDFRPSQDVTYYENLKRQFKEDDMNFRDVIGKLKLEKEKEKVLNLLDSSYDKCLEMIQVELDKAVGRSQEEEKAGSTMRGTQIPNQQSLDDIINDPLREFFSHVWQGLGFQGGFVFNQDNVVKICNRLNEKSPLKIERKDGQKLTFKEYKRIYKAFALISSTDKTANQDLNKAFKALGNPHHKITQGWQPVQYVGAPFNIPKSSDQTRF